MLNWGESTFIQNGINAINPFDVSKLRVPGRGVAGGAWWRFRWCPLLVELPEQPVGGGLLSTRLGEDRVIDPVGTYFSTTDYVGSGRETGGDSSISDPASKKKDLRRHGFGPLTPAINADLAAALPVPLPAQSTFDPNFPECSRTQRRTATP